MAHFYSIVFTPEEAERWMSYEDNKELGVTESSQYDLCSKVVQDQKIYFIVNELGEEVHNVWEKGRGDLVSFY